MCERKHLSRSGDNFDDQSIIIIWLIGFFGTFNISSGIVSRGDMK